MDPQWRQTQRPVLQAHSKDAGPKSRRPLDIGSPARRPRDRARRVLPRGQWQVQVLPKGEIDSGLSRYGAKPLEEARMRSMQCRGSARTEHDPDVPRGWYTEPTVPHNITVVSEIVKLDLVNIWLGQMLADQSTRYSRPKAIGCLCCGFLNLVSLGRPCRPQPH